MLEKGKLEREKLKEFAIKLREAKIDFEESGREKLNSENEKLFLAAKLKAYRVIYKLTQEALAKRIGLPKLQIVRWEGCKNMPSKMALEKLRREKII